MKKINLSIGLSAFLLFWTTFATAQIEYKIDYLAETENYQISLVVGETWVSPNNMTATGQITIKVPHGVFDVYEVRNLQNGVEWEDNSRYNAPIEAPEYDYISFGLTTYGTKGLKYEKGKEIPLFTFKNQGPCQGEVAIINNQTDPFLPPNSCHANIGNQITILGARGNAYIGNVGDGTATCALVNPIINTEDMAASFEIYPNPASEVLFINFDWQLKAQSVELMIFNILGEQVMKKTVSFVKGQNKISLNINTLIEGAYIIKMQGESWEISLPKFAKNK